MNFEGGNAYLSNRLSPRRSGLKAVIALYVGFNPYIVCAGLPNSCFLLDLFCYVPSSTLPFGGKDFSSRKW